MTITMHDVELRSYAIWEANGRPQGHDWDNWFRAEAELAEEEQAAPTTSADVTEPGPAAQRRKVKAAKMATADKDG